MNGEKDRGGEVVDAGGHDARAVAPFRQRHDGWTAERRRRFLDRLSETGCVREACRHVGLSSTSAYRAYARIPMFAADWDAALATRRRPMLEDAAFERAITGVVVPLTRLGQVVGERRRYSDGLLRFLIEREDRRAEQRQAAWAEARQTAQMRVATREETNAAILRKLRVVKAHMAAEERAAAIAFADRMTAEGKAP